MIIIITKHVEFLASWQDTDLRENPMVISRSLSRERGTCKFPRNRLDVLSPSNRGIARRGAMLIRQRAGIFKQLKQIGTECRIPPRDETRGVEDAFIRLVSHRLAIYHELRDSVGLSSTYYARDPRGCAAARYGDYI